jgi:hypothetical protein
LYAELQTAEWLHLALYRKSLFQREHYNSVLKYLVDIRNKDWLNLFWEYIDGKLFAVRVAKTKSRRKEDAANLKRIPINTEFPL